MYTMHVLISIIKPSNIVNISSFGNKVLTDSDCNKFIIYVLLEMLKLCYNENCNQYLLDLSAKHLQHLLFLQYTY